MEKSEEGVVVGEVEIAWERSDMRESGHMAKRGAHCGEVVGLVVEGVVGLLVE